MAVESKPPRYLFDRRTLGNMEVIQEVLDGITIGGATGSGVSALADKPWLSFLIAVGTVLLQLTKRGLVAVLARSLPTNPINTTEHTTVATPDPIDVSNQTN